jgi:predicted metalloprotease with PDZ domain
MKNRISFKLGLWVSIVALLLSCKSQKEMRTINPVKMDYFVSMEEPESHYLDVRLECEGLATSHTNFILPVWTPGYYLILDTPKHIVDFNVIDEQGNKITWSKKSKNCWVVENGNKKKLIVTYRFFANQKSVAESNVDKEKAFIMPNTIFLHIEDKINNPVNVTFKPFKNWNTISTGLKRSKENTNTFYSSNFDILYDSPVYIGNQHIIDFQHEGKSYGLAIATPQGLEETKFVSDLKKIISSTTSIMKDVPYDYYSFIMMESGRGGLEHWNSQAVFTNGSFNFKTKEDYTDFLNFITHEYFHLYNVKAIRPIELGPFDYSRENYTDMLWVSEGLTVYYEYIIMIKAALLGGQEALNYLTESIKRYENIEGSKHMSLARSSFDIWLNFFNKEGNAKQTSISYYDKGPIIGFLLDLEIRNSTKNQKSLDDVMRFLYNQYYLKEGRGFTNSEFWSACEKISGKPMEEIKEYVYTVKEIDYQKYLNYAALQIDLSPIDLDNKNEKIIKRSYKLSTKTETNKLQLDIRKSIFDF